MTGLNQTETGGRSYAIGVAVSLVACFVTVWTTIVRDDGNGMGFFAAIIAAVIAGFAVRFQALGLARALFGVAIMVILVGLAIATAPVTAHVPNGPFNILAFSALYAGLWLVSALCFWVAAKHNSNMAPAR